MVRKSVRLALASWKQPSSSQLNKHELFEDCDDHTLDDNLGIIPIRPPTPIQEEEEAEGKMGSGMVHKSESMPDLSALKNKMKKRKSLKQIKALVGLDLSPPKDAWFRRSSKVLSSSSGHNGMVPRPLISPTPSLSASDLSGDSFNSGLDLVSQEDDVGEGTSDTTNTSDDEDNNEDNSEDKGKRDSPGRRRTHRASSNERDPDAKKNPRRKRRSSDDKPMPSRSSSLPGNSFDGDDDKQGSEKKESQVARSSKINSKDRGLRSSTHHKDKDASTRSARSSVNHKEMSSRSKRRSSASDMLARTSTRSTRTTGGSGSDSNKDPNSNDEKARDESTRSSRTTGADSAEKLSTSAPSSSTVMKDTSSRKKEGSTRSRRRSSTTDMRSSRTTGAAVKDSLVTSGRDESTRSNRTTGLDSTASDEKPAAFSSVSRKEPSTRGSRTKRDRSRSKSRREPSRRGGSRSRRDGTSTRASRTSVAAAAKEASTRSSRTTGAYSSITKEPSTRSNRWSVDQRSSNEASARSSRTAGAKEQSRRSSRTSKDRSLLSQSVNESSGRRERTVLSQSLTDNNSTRRRERSSMSQSLREPSTRSSRTHQQPNRVLEEEADHTLTRSALAADRSNMDDAVADTKVNGGSPARKNLAKDEGTNRTRRTLSRRNRRQAKSPSAHRRSKRASFSETLNTTSKKDNTDVATPKALQTSTSTPSVAPARPRIALGEAEVLAPLRTNRKDTNSVWRPSEDSPTGKKKDSVMDNGVKFYSGNNDSLIEQIMSQSSHTRSGAGTPNSKGRRSSKCAMPKEFATAGEGSLSDMVMEFMEIEKPAGSSGNGTTKPEFRVSFHYDGKIDESNHTMDTSLHNSVGSNISGAASRNSNPSQTKSNRRKQMSRPNSGRDTWGRLSQNSLLGDVVV